MDAECIFQRGSVLLCLLLFVLGPLWKILHWFGSYYIFLMFFSGEVLRIQENPAHYAPYGAMLGLALILRIAARLSIVFKRFTRPAEGTATD